MTKDTFLNTLLPLQPAMQIVAERLLGSAVDAEDMVQEVVIELWEKRDRLQQVTNLEGYTMQTLKNHCISLLRKRKEILTDSIVEPPYEDARAEAFLLEERAAKLDRMMEQLPEKQRQAVQMHYIDQLSHNEMQQRLGMSSTHVYVTLSRAMSALKAMMKQ
ncbi:MAG: RNA polymerase sigma factor [Bacteroidales bacterium]|nr:RNA polymerase sigma factor [Bacteroidales bacterium]